MKHPDQSPESRQRQQRIEELQADIKRTRTTVKSLRTRWQNMSERIESITRNAFGQGADLVRRSAHLAEQLLEMLPQLDLAWLSDEERFVLEVMQPDFAGFIAEAEQLQEPEAGFEQYRQERAEDESRASAEDLFSEFRTAPAKEEKRDIRKLYLELSKRFHPDKARNTFEQRRFTEIQQQVTQAFEIGDTQALFELRERLLEDTEAADAAAAGDHDAEVTQIARLEREFSLLLAQKERLSEDIANLRNSPYGQVLTETDRIERESGIDMEESLAQQRQANELMEQLVAAFEDCLRRQARSPLLDALELPNLAEPEMPDIDLLDFLLDMAEEGEAFDEGFWDPGVDRVDFAFESPVFEPTDYVMDLDLLPPGWKPYASPKFKPGSAVGLKLPTELDLPRPERFSGRVLAVLRNADTRETVYLVQIDESYFQGMDQETLSYVLGEYLNYNPNTGMSMLKRDIVPYPRGKARRQGNTRRLYYEWGFNFLAVDPERYERFVTLLSRLGPQASDLQHWEAYLKEKITFPLVAKLRPEYAFGGWAEMQLRVLDWAPPHAFLGIMVHCEQDYTLPLHYFAATDEQDPVHEVLEDYLLWAETYVELFN